MDFNQLSWGTLCFYYRSSGDNRYGRIMRDSEFLNKLRTTPYDISPIEFEDKVLLGHVNVENYDLLIGHKLAESVLAKVTGLQPEISALQKLTILTCDLGDDDVTDKIRKIYTTLYSINGLWLTGVSKIAHLLNEKLFVLLNLDISNQFELLDGQTSLIQWLGITQKNALEVTNDFHERGHSGDPDEFLSEKLGYTEIGYRKSLVKFLDEYFWLRFGDNLPVPPRWVPPYY